MKNATDGVVVAGGQGNGDSFEQISWPGGIFVDRTGTVYVSDQGNDRLMRWSTGAEAGQMIMVGNGTESQKDLLTLPATISFDNEGNLYVADYSNHRIQRFDLL